MPAVIRALGRKRVFGWLIGSPTAVAIAGLYLLVFVSIASASFPGRTGQLVFEERVSDGPMGDGDDGCASCSSEVIRAFDPFSRRLSARNPCGDPVECADSSPSVSPDGRSIAFERPVYAPGADRDSGVGPDHNYLVVTDIRGRRTRLLADQAFSPAWSPSGKQLAFARSGTIFRVNSDGSDARPLVTNAGGDLDWSSRDRIAFTRKRGNHRNLYSVRADGTGRRRLTRDGYSEQASFSPDGRWIAFVKYRLTDLERTSKALGIFVMRSVGGPAERVTRRGFGPVWSPRGGRSGSRGADAPLPFAAMGLVSGSSSSFQRIQASPK